MFKVNSVILLFTVPFLLLGRVESYQIQPSSQGHKEGEQGIEALLKSARETEDFEWANMLLDSATSLSNTKGDQKSLAAIHRVKGDIYAGHNLNDMALADYFKALRINESLEDSLQMVDVFNKIASVYLITLEMDDALYFASRAKVISSTKGYREGIMNSTSRMGAAYQKKGDFDKALKEYRAALLMAEHPGYEHEKAILLGNIGSTYLSEGKLDSGLVYLQQTLKLKRRFSPEGSIIHTLNDLSEAFLILDRPEESVKYAQEALERSKATSNANQLRYAYLNLSKGKDALGDIDAAYRSLIKFNRVNDSLFGIEKERQIKELRVQYETDIKDHAITVLERDKELADLKKRSYLIIGILIILIVVALFNHQRIRANRNKRLLEKEQEIDRLKASFFANISHEFRTPLTLILSPIETMLEQEPEGKARTRLEMMKKSATRLLGLINGILDLSKLEAGQLKTEFQEVDVIEHLKGVTMSFGSLAESKNIALRFRCDQNRFKALCDADKIKTIVVNLVSNALKNSDSGDSVTVEVDVPEKSGDLIIYVTDTGKGISDEELPYIFDRYYQVRSKPPDRPESFTTSGSGIGLALSKQLVELQNGKITARSELGKGTSFRVAIPIEKTDPADGRAKEHSPRMDSIVPELVEVTEESLQTKEDTDGEKPLVLLIEDNEDVRNYLKSILSDRYGVLEAPDGLQGIDIAQTYIPDLIISDVMMPGIDGYETCTRLKNNEKTSHIPIILLTGKVSVDSRIAGLETEADVYLSKPFVPKELMLSIKNLIQSRRRLRERYNREIRLKPADISVNSIDEQFLARLMTALEKNYSNADFSVEQLGVEVGMSRSQIHRKLHALTNESSSRFIRSFRLQRAMEMLKQNAGTVSEISYLVGFNNPSYFHKCFLEHYGFTPASAIRSE